MDPTTGRTQQYNTRALIEISLMSPTRRGCPRRHPNYIHRPHGTTLVPERASNASQKKRLASHRGQRTRCIDGVGSRLHKFACSWRVGKTPGVSSKPCQPRKRNRLPEWKRRVDIASQSRGLGKSIGCRSGLSWSTTRRKNLNIVCPSSRNEWQHDHKSHKNGGHSSTFVPAFLV